MSIDCSNLVVSELPTLRSKQAPGAAEQPCFSETLELKLAAIACIGLYQNLNLTVVCSNF